MRCRSQPGFEVLLATAKTEANSFVFPTGYAAFLPNVTHEELAAALARRCGCAIPSAHTISRDVFMPWWENGKFALEQVKTALSDYMEETRTTVSLTAGQVRTLRAVIHPEIRLADRPETTSDTTAAEPCLNIDIAVLICARNDMHEVWEAAIA